MPPATAADVAATLLMKARRESPVPDNAVAPDINTVMTMIVRENILQTLSLDANIYLEMKSFCCEI